MWQDTTKTIKKPKKAAEQLIPHSSQDKINLKTGHENTQNLTKKNTQCKIEKTVEKEKLDCSLKLKIEIGQEE